MKIEKLKTVCDAHNTLIVLLKKHAQEMYDAELSGDKEERLEAIRNYCLSTKNITALIRHANALAMRMEKGLQNRQASMVLAGIEDEYQKWKKSIAK